MDRCDTNEISFRQKHNICFLNLENISGAYNCSVSDQDSLLNPDYDPGCWVLMNPDPIQIQEKIFMTKCYKFTIRNFWRKKTVTYPVCHIKPLQRTLRLFSIMNFLHFSFSWGTILTCQDPDPDRLRKLKPDPDPKTAWKIIKISWLPGNQAEVWMVGRPVNATWWKN